MGTLGQAPRHGSGHPPSCSPGCSLPAQLSECSSQGDTPWQGPQPQAASQTPRILRHLTRAWDVGGQQSGKRQPECRGHVTREKEASRAVRHLSRKTRQEQDTPRKGSRNLRLNGKAHNPKISISGLKGTLRMSHRKQSKKMSKWMTGGR